MPTKTPRERIHELIKQNYNENTARCVVALVMPVFDALLEEARQDTKKEFIKFVKEETSFPKMRLLDREDLLKFLSL